MILRELDAAKVVVVIWTKHSVRSEWVISEAGRAMRKPRDRYVAVREDGLDEHDNPPPFDVRKAAVVLLISIERALTRNDEAIEAALRRIQQNDEEQAWAETHSRRKYAGASSSDMDWSRLEAIMRFIKLFPNGKYVIQAVDEAEAWVTMLRDRGQHDDWLDACSKTILGVRETSDWRDAQASPSGHLGEVDQRREIPKNLTDFLRQHPHGQHATEAERQIRWRKEFFEWRQREGLGDF